MWNLFDSEHDSMCVWEESLKGLIRIRVNEMKLCHKSYNVEPVEGH